MSVCFYMSSRWRPAHQCSVCVWVHGLVLWYVLCGEEKLRGGRGREVGEGEEKCALLSAHSREGPEGMK